MSETTFNLLYSLYAFPNVVVPLFGGMLIDTKGPRLALLLTAGLCVIGQLIFSVGGLKNIWFVMLAGRVVFGLGGEVLHAAQNTIISQWFKASELSIVLGICISFPKMGSSLNSIISTTVSSQISKEHPGEKDGYYLGVGIPLVIGLGFMILSFILAFVLAYYDRKTEKLERVKHESEILSSRNRADSNPIPKSFLHKSEGEVKFIEKSEIFRDDKEIVEGGGHFDLKAIKQLPMTYWLLLFVAMLSEALFIPFLDNGNKYFQVVYKSIDKAEDAGIYLILPYVVSSFLVVPLGYFADKIKNRGYLLIGSCVFILVTYSFMLYTETSVDMRESSVIPWIPVFLLGVCIAIFCSFIVPTVPMICPPELLGSGFGMMEMLQNLALAVFPLLAGAIRETQADHENVHLGELKGFHLQTLFFYLISCLCVVFAIYLEAADRFRGNKLRKKDFRKTYISKIMNE